MKKARRIQAFAESKQIPCETRNNRVLSPHKLALYVTGWARKNPAFFVTYDHDIEF